MYFGINFNSGYEVCVTMLNDNGTHIIIRPLRRFIRQSDAIDFKLYDCPRFTFDIVNKMVKSYKKNAKYKRLGFRCYKSYDIDDIVDF